MDGWFDSPIESFKAAYRDAVNKWVDALESFDAAYAEFAANADYVHTSNDTELIAQYDATAGKVDLLASTIQGVKDALDSISNFMSSAASAVGLSGAQTMRGMGILPAIPWALVATITAGVAALYAVTNYMLSSNVAVANAKIAEQNILNSQQGKPLIPFIDLGDGPGGGGFMGGLSGTAKWITYGVLGFMALKLLENKRGHH